MSCLAAGWGSTNVASALLLIAEWRRNYAAADGMQVERWKAGLRRMRCLRHYSDEDCVDESIALLQACVTTAIGEIGRACCARRVQLCAALIVASCERCALRRELRWLLKPSLLRNEVCAIRWSRVNSTRVFLKTFWKSQLLQLLHLYPRRQDQDRRPRMRVTPIMARRVHYREDRNCAAVILFVDSIEPCKGRGEGLQQATILC